MFFGYRVRAIYYAALLEHCGEQPEVNFGATIAERRSRIGNRVWIGPGSYLDLVEIGDDVLIGPRVTILGQGGYHRTERLDVPIRRQGNHPMSPTVIADGAWIGAASVVLANIGEGAIVGAGSVVTKPVDPYMIVGGNPAAVIGDRRTGTSGKGRGGHK
jgi:acetyltransferase-like isoleucine patch superfamily enzyme